MSAKSTRATQEPGWVRIGLLAIGLGFLFFFLGLPLVAVFVEALAHGVPVYLEALKEPETRSAIGRPSPRRAPASACCWRTRNRWCWPGSC